MSITGTNAQNIITKCSCLSIVKEAEQKVATIYAGFDDKVTPTTSFRYTAFLKQLHKEASKASNERQCYTILKQYAAFFKDAHLDPWFAVQSSMSQQRIVPLSWIPDDLSKRKKGLEGIWSTADKKKRYAIIRDPEKQGEFVAVTLADTTSSWKPGMLRAEIFGYDKNLSVYRGLLYQTNFNGLLNGFALNGNRIDPWFAGPSWYREEGTEKAVTQLTEKEERAYLKILNKDFIYLRLKNFMVSDVIKLDSLIKANRNQIRFTKYLILDLRGNPGGDGSTSAEMINLIYTNPIIYPSGEMRSSPETIKDAEAEISQLNNQKSNEWLLARAKKRLNALEEHPGQLIKLQDSIIRKQDSIQAFPQKIALLVDRESGSSAEYFTFECRQSKKVVAFGSNTYGVMDYGNAQSYTLSCGQYTMQIPTTRNGWIRRFGLRIDGVGLTPDVKIPDTDHDWVKYVMNWWSK